MMKLMNTFLIITVFARFSFQKYLLDIKYREIVTKLAIKFCDSTFLKYLCTQIKKIKQMI